MIENNFSALELAQQYKEVVRQRDELLVALEKAAAVFRAYSELHDSKGATEKAISNMRHAMSCEEVIARVKGGRKDEREACAGQTAEREGLVQQEFCKMSLLVDVSRRGVELGQKLEREACAKVCEDFADGTSAYEVHHRFAAYKCADLIRKRGEE